MSSDEAELVNETCKQYKSRTCQSHPREVLSKVVHPKTRQRWNSRIDSFLGKGKSNKCNSTS